MWDAKAVQVIGPLLKRWAIEDSQRKVVEAHCTLFKPAASRDLVDQETKMHATWVVHIPDSKSRLLGRYDQTEAQDLRPPPHAPLAIGNCEVDVSEAFDSRGGHAVTLQAERSCTWQLSAQEPAAQRR
jgi:hypothetical protein